MGYPTDNAAQIDAAIQALADKIVAFTDEITNISNENVETIPVDISVDPVASISGLGPSLEVQPTYETIANNPAIYTGLGSPTISSTSIEQLSVPNAPSYLQAEFGLAPTQETLTVPVSPTLQTTVIPVKPDLSIPAVPELANIELPVLNTPVLPTFTEAFPAVPDSLVAPVNSFAYTEEDYISTELTNLRALLNDDLVNGGWGINGHQDEEDLFERQRARMRRELIVDEEQLFDTFSARGFDIPQGDQVDQVRVLQKQTIDKLQEVELDISNSRADLIRKSRENVISQVNTLNQTMTTYRGFMQQRLMQAAEFLASHSINIFNAQVERHNLVITAYNSYVGSYQAQVDAAVSQIQISKIAIEAEALKSDINRNTVQLYQAQIESVTSLIQMYQVEVDAAKTLSEIERDKLEIFNAEIEAYKSQISAEIGKVNLYSAQIGTEEIKSRIFANNINAYEAEVRANVSERQSYIEEANLRVREKSLLLERYRSEIDLYRANIERESGDLRANAAIFGTKGSNYGTYSSQFASWVSSLVQEENVEVQASVAEATVESKNAQFNADSENTRAKLQSDAAAAAAKIFADYASASAQINTNLDIDVL